MRKVRIILFILLAVIQLFVAGKMIGDRQRILDDGEVYRFVIEPVDPNDPFRGKYLTLGFESDHLKAEASDSEELIQGRDVLIKLSEDANGFAWLSEISSGSPEEDFLRLKIDRIVYSNSGEDMIYFNMPFDRYYLNEEMAAEAEERLQKALQDTENRPYAIVRVLDGRAVLEELVLNDKPLSEWLSE